MWRVGRGREPWERSEAGGVIGNEPPAPLTGLESHGGASEGLNEEWQQWKMREDQAWIFFFGASLSSSGLLSQPHRLSSARLVCPYPQVRRGRPDGLPPGEGGGGE